MTFLQKLEGAIAKNNSLVCIGLDTDIEKIPKHLFKKPDPILEFNKAIINTTSDLVCCFKANIAFYSALGIPGLQSLKKTIDYIHARYTGIPVIMDTKRADIESTSEQYAKEVFDVLEADAVTVNPYLGFDSIEPFLRRIDKGVFVLCRTSNPGAGDFQDTKVSMSRDKFEPLYLFVAKKIVEWNKKYRNCLMVVGATWPEEIKTLRKIAANMFFLVPGIGSQGADLKKTLRAGLRKDGSGLIIHSARAIIYASSDKDFAEKSRQEAKKIRDIINNYR